MKTQRTWPYVSLAALMGLAGCSTSLQTAQNAGETDDLYGSSATASVYEGNSRPAEQVENSRTTMRQRERERLSRNTNPDYSLNDEKRGYDPNQDEYYTELSARNVKRGLSADPGWNTGSYNDGFTDGYYAGIGNPAFNSVRWNPWGWNSGFNTGLSLGLGFGSAFGSPWGYGGGYGGYYGGYNRFYDPFWGGGFGSYAYSPWGYGGGYGFGSPFGYGYDPFYSGYYGGFGGYGGGWGRPVIINNNTIVSGADPYRSTRTYGARGAASTSRYNDNFNNTPRNYNPRSAGGRTATGTYGTSSPTYGSNRGTTTTGSSDGYYARPRQNTRGTYYYENSGSTTTRGSSDPASTYSNNGGSSRSNGGYYAAPRQNSRGSYSPPSNSGSSNQPSYQTPQRSTYESRPSYSQPSQPSYSAPAPSYNSGSRGGSSGGGGYSGGGGGGGSRGPR